MSASMTTTLRIGAPSPFTSERLSAGDTGPLHGCSRHIREHSLVTFLSVGTGRFPINDARAWIQDVDTPSTPKAQQPEADGIQGPVQEAGFFCSICGSPAGRKRQ